MHKGTGHLHMKGSCDAHAGAHVGLRTHMQGLCHLLVHTGTGQAHMHGLCDAHAGLMSPVVAHRDRAGAHVWLM